MIGRMVNWLNRKWASKPRQSAEEAFSLLQHRSSAEIAARLLRRAELFERSHDNFLKKCAALDKVAAENMRQLVLNDANQQIGEWLDKRDLCLRLLREGKN
jgi:hypothetical protein